MKSMLHFYSVFRYEDQQKSIVTEMVSISSGYSEPLASLGASLSRLDVITSLAMAAVSGLLQYVGQPQSPPWSCCLLLSPDTQADALEHLQKVWSVKLRLESSSEALHAKLLQRLGFLSWFPCFRMRQILKPLVKKRAHRADNMRSVN